MIFGFMLEAQMGTLRLMCFWFAAGISGNLFGATANDEYATGCEPALFAYMAGLIGMMAYYWDRLGDEDDFGRKCCGLFFMIFLMVLGIYLLTSFASQYKNYTRFYDIAYPDAMGFLGGALFGFFMSWVFFIPDGGSIKGASRRQTGLFIAGLAVSLCLLLLIICIFAFSIEPEEYWYY